MDNKVRYLNGGTKVMEADATELARWYISCYREGDFTSDPPGIATSTSQIDFREPFHEYDDPEYFLYEIARLCCTPERKILLKEIKAFLTE